MNSNVSGKYSLIILGMHYSDIKTLSYVVINLSTNTLVHSFLHNLMNVSEVLKWSGVDLDNPS